MDNEHGSLWTTPGIAVSLTVVGFLAMATVAVAQTNTKLPQVTVQASGKVKHEVTGTTYSGIPIEQLSLSRQVGFSDLDLHTEVGREKLRARIRATAEEACKQLSSLYPLESWTSDNQTCVHDATNNAMAQMRTVVAEAERHGTPR